MRKALLNIVFILKMAAIGQWTNRGTVEDYKL